MSFSLWEKVAFKFKVKKAFAVVCQRKDVLAHFAIVSVKLSISLPLKEKKFKVCYDVVIY